MIGTVVACSAATGFAVVNGCNDGGALLTAGVSGSGVRPSAIFGIAGVVLAVAPVLGGVKVARTLTDGITPLSGRADLLLVIVGAASVVVWVASRRGAATSITVALVGAIAGAGYGAGLPVRLVGVARIVGLAIAAPIVAAFVARAIGAVLVRYARGERIRRLVMRARLAAFSALCVAYAANDGQKILAVFALAVGLQLNARSPLTAAVAAGSAVVFVAGMWFGARAVACRLARGLGLKRPYEATVVDLSTASVILCGAAVGAPMSMTQAYSGAMVGLASVPSVRRVRWGTFSKLAVTWLVTAPLAGVVSFGTVQVLRCCASLG